MLSEYCQVSLESPSKSDFPLLVFYTCQSPSAETWKGINISTNTTSPASCSAFYFSNMNVNYNVDLISTLFLESTQHSGSSNIVGKILLADCRQTGSALDLHSSWKNDTVIYSEHWYHPSKSSLQHIPLCTASCVMKSDNTLPCF